MRIHNNVNKISIIARSPIHQNQHCIAKLLLSFRLCFPKSDINPTDPTNLNKSTRYIRHKVACNPSCDLISVNFIVSLDIVSSIALVF